MTDLQQRKAAREFSEYWENKGYEKGESQPFWLSLLRDVFGIEHPERFISFEETVKIDNTSYIDGYIRDTNVLIEQKSKKADLNKYFRQSDGTLLTPFEQAKRYSIDIPYSKRPRWIVTSNFQEFHVYDMEHPHSKPEIILLKELEKEYWRLAFLVDQKNIHLHKEIAVSLAAGDIVGLLYDALLKQYDKLHLERGCMYRLVF